MGLRSNRFDVPFPNILCATSWAATNKDRERRQCCAFQIIPSTSEFCRTLHGVAAGATAGDACIAVVAGVTVGAGFVAGKFRGDRTMASRMAQ